MSDSQLRQTISQLHSSAGVTPRFPTWQNQASSATQGMFSCIQATKCQFVIKFLWSYRFAMADNQRLQKDSRSSVSQRNGYTCCCALIHPTTDPISTWSTNDPTTTAPLFHSPSIHLTGTAHHLPLPPPYRFYAVDAANHRGAFCLHS